MICAVPSVYAEEDNIQEEKTADEAASEEE